MGRLMSGKQDQDLPLTIVVEHVPTKKTVLYIVRMVSDVLVKAGNSICKFSDAHRSTLDESKGEEPRGVNSDSQRGSE